MFSEVISIWIKKPNVVHKKLFGAKLLTSSATQIIRYVYPKLNTNVQPFTEIVNIKEDLFEFLSSHASYLIKLNGGEICVLTTSIECDSLFSRSWFEDCLQRKLRVWIKSNLTKSPCSLNSIDLWRYQQHYERIKSNYAAAIISSWTEKTDPEKFVHEDIGITAYLLSIWQGHKDDIFFVDIGCGNGLLPFFLISEGYKGIGIDLRKRKIWDKYPSNISEFLREETIVPSTHPGFPDATVLIGNHSDELTPWLPILAARSNAKCQKFDSGRYLNQRQQRAYSELLPVKIEVDEMLISEEGAHWRGRYRQYISYLADVFRICGFQPNVDILRIPSTKRLCLFDQTILPEPFSDRLSRISKLVQMESEFTNKTEFVPRPDTRLQIPNLCQRERNRICEVVFDELLKRPSIARQLQKARSDLFVSDDDRLESSDGRLWNCGGSLSLEEAIKLVSKFDLLKLKSVPGGLQTLLRNHHQAFIVTKNCIILRFDSRRFSRSTYEPPLLSTEKLYKTKPCWMETNHPDGCPYSSDLCAFIHHVNDSQSGTCDG